jgi:uncharacterized protein (TIGR02246 family)
LEDDPVTAEEEIRSLVDSFMSGWNLHDAAAFAATFSEDAWFTNWNGYSVRGRVAVEQLHAPLFATRFRETNMVADDVKVWMLRADLASVDVRCRQTGARDAEDNPRPERFALLSWVVENGTSGWKVRVMHNTDLTALPPKQRYNPPGPP